ncbi:hypothetical protein HGRIS_008760 [Hohenbuehelia grisea]|uniref:Protein kinase domain-containing protein n=1 Tax=Hohenbuehelia grisea TaxID=104357 RepID=A0ABR3J9H3_9AGAR
MADANDVFKPQPPSKLGEYTIVGHIADGTFGKVKQAVHTITGHKVAMKFISKAMIQQSKTKVRVQREVEYMRTLQHPHIIKLYEVISTPTDIIIVLEFAGGELFKYIVEHGRMSESRARRFFQQIVSGVEYTHINSIVHRDMKPENVLLDDDLNVKIADFGLSNEIVDGSFLKTSCGSPNYAAPEVISGQFYTGPEIDIWSCGVILYVMLCGKLPFEDDDVQVLFQKISQGSYHMPSHLSSDAKNLISSMLAVDPVKRITIEQITKHPFFTVDLPRYLTPLPPPPVLGALTTLVSPPKALDFEMIEGLGRIEEDVIDELAQRMEGVDKDDIWECLRRDDGPQGNAVKVAYLLLRDKRRLGRDLAEFAEQERDAQLAAMDVRYPSHTPYLQIMTHRVIFSHGTRSPRRCHLVAEISRKTLSKPNSMDQTTKTKKRMTTSSTWTLSLLRTRVQKSTTSPFSIRLFRNSILNNIISRLTCQPNAHGKEVARRSNIGQSGTLVFEAGVHPWRSCWRFTGR